MSKYIIFSFDDGRVDTYKNVIPIIEEYGLTCTINLTTDYILNPDKFHFESAPNGAMTLSDIKDCIEKKIEIANHSDTHRNTVEDIEKSLSIMKNWNLGMEKIGFASPFSYITQENLKEISMLLDDNEIQYVRSGIQVHRENLLYKALFVLQEITHSKKAFYFLNKKNIFNIVDRNKLLFGISIRSNTKVQQLTNFIERMSHDECAIFIFHSILGEEEFKVGSWYWEEQNFRKLCSYVNKNPDVKVIRTIDLF